MIVSALIDTVENDRHIWTGNLKLLYTRVAKPDQYEVPTVEIAIEGKTALGKVEKLYLHFDIEHLHELGKTIEKDFPLLLKSSEEWIKLKTKPKKKRKK